MRSTPCAGPTNTSSSAQSPPLQTSSTACFLRIGRNLPSRPYGPKRSLLTRRTSACEMAYCMLFKDRLIVPDTNELRGLLIREIHDQPSVAHPGRNKTVQLVSERYYWRGLHASVERYVRNCHACQKSQVPKDKTPGLLRPLQVPNRPWQHGTMDLCEFNTDKDGHNSVFVVIDRFSKQAISIPCHKTLDAKRMAALYTYHIYRYFGAPESIVSDRGPQFISRFWNEFQGILGTKVVLTSLYHPQSDGQTEISTTVTSSNAYAPLSTTTKITGQNCFQ